MNKNQCAHMKGDLYGEIRRLEKRNERLLTGLIAGFTLAGSILLVLAWYAQYSIVLD